MQSDNVSGDQTRDLRGGAACHSILGATAKVKLSKCEAAILRQLKKSDRPMYGTKLIEGSEILNRASFHILAARLVSVHCLERRHEERQRPGQYPLSVYSITQDGLDALDASRW